MMEHYALFLDIDNTLTSDKNVIPQRNIDALKKARKLGHKVIINTGRSFGNIPDKIGAQIEYDGVVSGNGSAIHIGNKLIKSRFMDNDVLEKVARFCFDNTESWAIFEGYRKSYCINDRSRKPTPENAAVSSYENFMEQIGDDRIQVIAVEENFSTDFLKEMDNEITFFKFQTYYDLTSKGCNKAGGMLEMLKLLGIPKERSIAFGDGDNDCRMLMEAGTGVAVANAQQHVLDIADYITLSNYEGGVGAAIEELLLKGEKL